MYMLLLSQDDMNNSTRGISNQNSSSPADNQLLIHRSISLEASLKFSLKIHFRSILLKEETSVLFFICLISIGRYFICYQMSQIINFFVCFYFVMVVSFLVICIFQRHV